MSVQRWKPSWAQGRMIPAGVHPVDGYVSAADHARIVAEMEQRAHTPRNCGQQENCGYCISYNAGYAAAEQAHAAALAAAVAAARAEVVTVELVGDYATGYNAGLIEGDAKGRREGKRLAEAAAAPRTLTAADPGYHSQRCLHCDHIRATHTLTAHGCIGHALPGRPGADCPCAEFIHDGEDRYSRLGREASETMTAMDARRAAIHDGEATPEVKPCSTCGEPVAYLTARPGWAGGWLHHPARPLDGHPAAIDEEATP